MFRFVFGLLTMTASAMSQAGGVNGVWQTKANDSGGYLEVTISPCESDVKKTCGIITAAYSGGVARPGYQNLGKLIIRDMTSDDGVSYSGGTIWDPEKDKTVKSKLKVNGDQLIVQGCVAFVCVTENWTRVQ